MDSEDGRGLALHGFFSCLASGFSSGVAVGGVAAAGVRRSAPAGGEDHRQLHLSRSGGGSNSEQLVGHLRREVPLADRHLVLRHLVFGLVGDHQLPGQRLRARVDPQLPVDRLLLEGQVVARDAGHVVDAEVDPALHAAHQVAVDVGVEEVRERDHHPRPIQGRVHGPVDGRRHVHPDVDVLRVVEHRDRLPVVPDAPVHGVARRGAGQAVRTPQRHVAAAGELDAREVLRHLVVDLLGLESERLRRRREGRSSSGRARRPEARRHARVRRPVPLQA